MAKSEKKREPRVAADTKILPMGLRVGDRLIDETGEWEVILAPIARQAWPQALSWRSEKLLCKCEDVLDFRIRESGSGL